MDEHSFIRSVHYYLQQYKKQGADLWLWKIHDTYAGGVPDAMYVGPTGSLWVEYKYITLPKKDNTVIDLKLSSLQRKTIKTLQDYNQDVIVVVGFDNEAAIIHNVDEKHNRTSLWTLSISRESLAKKILKEIGAINDGPRRVTL